MNNSNDLDLPEPFKEKHKRLTSDFNEKKSKFVITIYGAYGKEIHRDNMLLLKKYLEENGYTHVYIVALGPDDIFINSLKLNDIEKSYFYLESSDFNILIFFQEANNDGVGIETKYVLDHELIHKSSFVFEMRLIEEYGEKKLIPNVSRLIQDIIRLEPIKYDMGDSEQMCYRVGQHVDHYFYNKLFS